MNTLQAGRFNIFCVYLMVWTRRSSKCTLLVSFRARRTGAHTHTHTHTHTHFSLRNNVSRADCAFNVLLSNMSSNLVTVKTAFYNNQKTIDLILTLNHYQYHQVACSRDNAAQCPSAYSAWKKYTFYILTSFINICFYRLSYFKNLT